jgi:hypothetical protein
MTLSNGFQDWFKLQKNLLDYRDCERETWLIDGVLPSGSIVFITGQPKSGKSLVAQHWAHSVATGNDWNGHVTQQGAVFYLYPDGEHPRYLADRFEALDIHTGQRVDYETALRFEDTFAISNQLHRDNVLQGLAFAGLRLVVIDTLAAASPGVDLNNAAAITEISDFAKAIVKNSNAQTSVVIVLHSPKSNSNGVSGSTQIAAFASLIYGMETKGTNGENKTYKLTAIQSRHTSGEYEDAFRAKLIQLEGENTSIVLATTEPVTHSKTAYKNELEAFFPDLEPGQWIQQSGFIKEIQSRLKISDSSARRWLTGATNAGVLHRDGNRRETRFCVPSPQSPQTAPSGDSLSVPTITHTLRGGDWGQETETL